MAADLNFAGGEALIGTLEVRDYAGRVDFVRTEVSVEADVEATVRAVPERHGRLDCVVNE